MRFFLVMLSAWMVVVTVGQECGNRSIDAATVQRQEPDPKVMLDYKVNAHVTIEEKEFVNYDMAPTIKYDLAPGMVDYSFTPPEKEEEPVVEDPPAESCSTEPATTRSAPTRQYRTVKGLFGRTYRVYSSSSRRYSN